MAVSKAQIVLSICGLLASGAFGRHLLQETESQTVRWYVPGNGDLGTVNVPVPGSVTFSWTSQHDLWEIPSLSCPATFANGSGITQLSPQVNGGSRTVEYATAGTRYYTCSVDDHCSQGQIITISIGAASPGPAPAPGPTSRYGSGYGGGRGCGGNSTSGSGYGGSSGSGSNYAGAPGTSAYGGGSSNSTGSNSTSSYGGGSSSYSGGGAGYAGGSSSNYGSGEG